VNGNIWLRLEGGESEFSSADLRPQPLQYEVLETEESVGRAMFAEIETAARDKPGDLVIVLLGGRGAQALHRLLREVASRDAHDSLLGRLQVFTQDALAPMRMNNGLSFVRDFERLLGPDFFQKIKSFTCIRTETDDPEAELTRYIEQLELAGGIDIFFMGLGPEDGGASHLAYIKPSSGAEAMDMAGMIPISNTILEHHISKFKVGGSTVTEADERECRLATHILTLGPGAILRAKRIVQSIVDAGTAPGKRASFQTLLNARIAREEPQRATQFDENPGLWLRLHPNVRSLVLPDLLEH
jgi:6-phosphogluconolactonase/glucosamine-6-phosphate isomerase/deaminase